ncbi:hypothetical protein VNI00_016893 [Paramarasmius palmivorus]|uniref:MYND-type domain-containing protein n=1 Tax=Paramarasmius palmivorus TaxID=297713 RepID=A0AAW0BAH5_9AGAR
MPYEVRQYYITTTPLVRVYQYSMGNSPRVKKYPGAPIIPSEVRQYYINTTPLVRVYQYSIGNSPRVKQYPGAPIIPSEVRQYYINTTPLVRVYQYSASNLPEKSKTLALRSCLLKHRLNIRLPLVAFSQMLPPHRTIPLSNPHGYCEHCSSRLDSWIERCDQCSSAVYCSNECRFLHLPRHYLLCYDLTSLAEHSERTLLGARLLKSGRLFVDTYYNPIRAAAAHRALEVLDSHRPDNEPRWSFFRCVCEVTDQYLWLFFLQEKDEAPRIGEPRANDLRYPYPSSRAIQVVRDDYPGDQSSMEKALEAKAAVTRNNTGILVAFWIRDRDGNTVADFVTCMDIPTILDLQFSYFTQTPEQDLANCS